MSLTEIKEENIILRKRIEQFKQQRMGNSLQSQMQKFLLQSKKNIEQMSNRSSLQLQKRTEHLQQVTKQYQSTLKEQLALLQENKSLSEQRQSLDLKVQQETQRLTKQYEEKINQLQKKVQLNVKRIQQFSDGKGLMNRLLKNVKVQALLKQKGCNLQGLQKQAELQQMVEQVQLKQKEIQQAERKSSLLDQEVQKMRQLVQTMKELLQNMNLDKENFVRQNTLLKQKLKESQDLIGKLIGNDKQQGQGQEENVEQPEEQDGEDGEKQGKAQNVSAQK